MRPALLCVLLAAPACDFSNDYAVYCGNTGHCGVQLRTSTCQSAAGTSLAATLTGVETGDLLVVTVDRFFDMAPDATLTDSLGNTFQPAFDGKAAPPLWTRTFLATATGAGSDQVTATFSSQEVIDLFVTAFASVPAPSKVDQATSSQGPSGAADPGTLTTTVADELMYATAISSSSVANVSGNFQVLSTCNGNMVAWRAGGPVGAYDPAFDANGGAFLTAAVSFR